MVDYKLLIEAITKADTKGLDKLVNSFNNVKKVSKDVNQNLDGTEKETKKVEKETNKNVKAQRSQFRMYLSVMFAARNLNKALSSIGGELQGLYTSTILEATGMSLMASYMDSAAGILEEQFVDGVSDAILALDELVPGLAGATIRFGTFATGLLGTASEAAIVVSALGGKKGILSKLTGIGDFFATNTYGRAMVSAVGLGLWITGNLTIKGPEGEINWGSVASATTGAAMLGYVVGGGKGAAIAAAIQQTVTIGAIIDQITGEKGIITWGDVIAHAGQAAMIGYLIGGGPGAAVAAALGGGAALIIKLEMEFGVLTKMRDFIKSLLEYLADLVDALTFGVFNVRGNMDSISPNIQEFATGGIVTSPTLAMIGEAGPEAVIPLSKMGGMGGGGDTYITVHAAVSNDYDVKRLAQQIGVEMYNLRRTI